MIKYVIGDIKGNPVQCCIFIVPVIILSFLLYAGITVNRSLDKGIVNMRQRLGADIMLVPEGAKEKAEDIIIEGARGTFAFDRSVYEAVKDSEGVKSSTPQLFFKSLSADCCSSEVEIVFFDPDTDFIVRPWISREYDHDLGKGSVIAGFSITCENDTIRLFGEEFKVASQMAKTGTSLDNSVYFTFDSIPLVLDAARTKGSFLTDRQQDADLISSVFVNVEDNKITDVLAQIDSKTDTAFDVVYPRQLDESLSSNISGVYNTVKLFLIVSVILAALVLFASNLIIGTSRLKEASVLRIMGVTRSKILRILCLESSILTLIGSIAGSLIGILLVIPFGNYIGFKLDMPYLGPGIIEAILVAIAVIILSFVTGAVASFYPVLQISNGDPYSALRKEGE